MDKAMNYVALAKKARLIELGEEPVGAVTRAGKGRLVIVASDAGDHTWRRAKSFVAGTSQVCVRIPQNKDELGLAVGRQSLAIAAFTDIAMALAFLKGLPPKYPEELAALEDQLARQKQRQKEAKAHKRNVKTGKK